MAESHLNRDVTFLNSVCFFLDCPLTALITSGDSKSFMCTATSAVTPTYQWTDSVSQPAVSTVLFTGRSYTVPSTTPGEHTLVCSAAVTSGQVTCPVVSSSVQVPVVGKCHKKITFRNLSELVILFIFALSFYSLLVVQHFLLLNNLWVF